VNRRCSSGSCRVVVRREGAALRCQRGVVRRPGSALWCQQGVLQRRQRCVVRRSGATRRGRGGGFWRGSGGVLRGRRVARRCQGFVPRRGVVR
jgi:hypothetical protein